MKRRDLMEMLWAFGQAFAKMATTECPRAAAHVAFQAWLVELHAASEFRR